MAEPDPKVVAPLVEIMHHIHKATPTGSIVIAAKK